MTSLIAALSLSAIIASSNPTDEFDPSIYWDNEFGATCQEDYAITNEEFELIAETVMNEEGHSCEEAQQAVAEVIINRVKSDRFPNTVYDVIHQPNQFSTVRRTPTESCYLAVLYALTYNAYPDDLYWFRLNYSSYGYTYAIFNNTYFSTASDYDSMMMMMEMELTDE